VGGAAAAAGVSVTLTRSTRLVEHRGNVLPASVPVDLAWNAPAECPARDAVVDEVARVLSSSHERRVAVTVRADVSRDDSGRWHAALRVDMRDAHGERTLDAESCPAIASATAVIVAIAVEGGMPEPVPGAPPPENPERPVPQRVQLRASQVIVGAAAVIDASTWPSLAPGVEGTLGLAQSWSTWRVRAFATGGFFPWQDSSPLLSGSDAPGEYGRFELFTASVRACASLVRGAFDVGPCLGGEVDVMIGTGASIGPAQPTPDSGAWASALGSVLASWSFLRHAAIFLRADAFYAPLPPQFGVYSPAPSRNPINVYEPPHIGARGALGVEVRFF
jgi:hypothetical protein